MSDYYELDGDYAPQEQDEPWIDEAAVALERAGFIAPQDQAALAGETCPNCGQAVPCGGHEPDSVLAQLVACAYAAYVQRSLVTRHDPGSISS